MIDTLTEKISITVSDKVGNLFSLYASEGSSVEEFLRSNNIPSHASIVFKNGEIVSDAAIINSDDKINVKFVGSYDLKKILNLQKKQINVKKDSIYIKSNLIFDQGKMFKEEVGLDAPAFKKYVENKFLDSVINQNFINNDDKIIIGFSGGLDSTALMLLLKRMENQLPKHSIIAATVVGIPDADNEASIVNTTKICNSLGIEQRIVSPEEIMNVFNLRKPFFEVVNDILKGPNKHKAIYCSQRVTSVMLEKVARENNAKKIALGLELEDLVATILYWITTGYELPGLLNRKSDDLTYIYPLYNSLKREHTLYLYLTAPEYTNQHNSGRVHIEAPLKRTLYLVLQDKLREIWPDLQDYLYKGVERIMTKTNNEIRFKRCSNCEGVIVVQKLGEQNEEDSELCDACQLFKSMNVLKIDL
jgi:tRNA(Ile)-lysidine synthase TilS/MesJ/sulfur carrier protein ThiS